MSVPVEISGTVDSHDECWVDARTTDPFGRISTSIAWGRIDVCIASLLLRGHVLSMRESGYVFDVESIGHAIGVICRMPPLMPDAQATNHTPVLGLALATLRSYERLLSTTPQPWANDAATRLCMAAAMKTYRGAPAMGSESAERVVSDWDALRSEVANPDSPRAPRLLSSLHEVYVEYGLSAMTPQSSSLH